MKKLLLHTALLLLIALPCFAQGIAKTVPVEVFSTGAVVTDAITLNAQTGVIDFMGDVDGFVWTNSYLTANSTIILMDMTGQITSQFTLTRGSGTCTVAYTAGGSVGNVSFIIFNP